MKHKAITLALLLSISFSAHGMKKVKRLFQKRPRIERVQTNNVTRGRERELSLERDIERAEAMTKCLDISKIIVTLTTSILGIILASVR